MLSFRSAAVADEEKEVQCDDVSTIHMNNRAGWRAIFFRGFHLPPAEAIAFIIHYHVGEAQRQSSGQHAIPLTVVT